MGFSYFTTLAYPQCFHSDRNVVSFPDSFVDIAILPSSQLMLHYNVSPEKLNIYSGSSKELTIHKSRHSFENLPPPSCNIVSPFNLHPVSSLSSVIFGPAPPSIILYDILANPHPSAPKWAPM